jgi:hypothetical protein
MKNKVFILTYCRNFDLFYGTELIFKTIRIGFPNSDIFVYDNNSIKEAQDIIENYCIELKINLIKIKNEISHSRFIEEILKSNRGRIVFVDPDVIFWKNIENLPINGLLGGRYVPKFVDDFTGCITLPRIHTSLMIIPDSELLKEELTNISQDKFEVDFFNPYMYFNGEKWYRLDTCSSLYLSIKNKIYKFTDEDLEFYDHIFCGSHIDLVLNSLGEYRDRMMEVHKLAKSDYNKLKGIYKEQNIFFKDSEHSDI